MQPEQFRQVCKYLCYLFVILLLFVLYQNTRCPMCTKAEHYQMIGPNSTLASVAKDAKFRKYVLTPEPMPYTTESASGIPIQDVQAQKMFTVLPEQNYRMNDTYALGGVDEAIYLAETAFDERSKNHPVFLAQSGTIPNVPYGGATDDLRIVQENQLNRLE